VAVKIKVDGTTLKGWVAGTLEINTTDSTFGAGAVAFSGQEPKFDDLKVGYDENDDDDIDDVGDKLVADMSFGSTSTTFSYDDAGNLVDDGTFIYTYDAWHRLVEVTASEDTDVTVATYSYDGKGRRIKKVVQNSGDLDGTELLYYNGHQVIEARDGSENVLRQVVHGTRYIDEVVLEILEDGVAWVHQDANWNVMALTDFAGRVLERNHQTPYGVITVDQETYFGDSDGDGKVTEDEWDTDEDGSLDSDDDCWGSSPSGDCRLVDFDFDDDVDSADATTLASLDSSTTYRRFGQPYSGIGNTRGHQGLIYDAEIASYNNRARQYDPKIKLFMQRDPLVLRPRAGDGYQDGLNLYCYVRGNPVIQRDASGRTPQDTCDGAPAPPSSAPQCWCRQAKLWDKLRDKYPTLNPSCRSPWHATPGGGLTNDECNAVFHCMSSCQSARKLSPTCAEAFAQNREWPLSTAENCMDYLNNRSGIINSHGSGACLSMCLDDLFNGVLVCGSTGPVTTCR
jgi:RHS repeat-associated protein